jgi:hypothetical protein
MVFLIDKKLHKKASLVCKFLEQTKQIMMVQLKIILDKRRRKADGTLPIVYKVIDIKKFIAYIQEFQYL